MQSKVKACPSSLTDENHFNGKKDLSAAIAEGTAVHRIILILTGRRVTVP